MRANKAPSVLFICTANICRSPMAAALFRQRLEKERPDWRAWKIASAGTWAHDGEMASVYSQQVMAEKGLDLSSHRSRMVTAELLQEYNLILTMEAKHKEVLQIEFPFIARQVFLLSEMEGKAEPVNDPFGGSLQDYHAAARKMDSIFENGMQQIIMLAAG